jgi:hypothetical protein
MNLSSVVGAATQAVTGAVAKAADMAAQAGVPGMDVVKGMAGKGIADVAKMATDKVEAATGMDIDGNGTVAGVAAAAHAEEGADTDAEAKV